MHHSSHTRPHFRPLMLVCAAALCACGPKQEQAEARDAALHYAVAMHSMFQVLGLSGMADGESLRECLNEDAFAGPFQIIQKQGSEKLRHETDELRKLVMILPEAAKKDSRIDLFALLGVPAPTDEIMGATVISQGYEAAFERYATAAGVREGYLEAVKPPQRER